MGRGEAPSSAQTPKDELGKGLFQSIIVMELRMLIKEN